MEDVTINIASQHRYFVSFWWQDQLSPLEHGFGNLVADLEGPIRSGEHLTDLTTRIREEAKVRHHVLVVIANIVRLDWP